jgi:Bacteriocin-protection, YdeI or OmpD-Associated/Domain of unknown function (DUF1905)
VTDLVAPIEGAPRGGAHVVIPGEVVERLGGGGRIAVRASFDGVEYRGSIVRMGEQSVLGVLKEIRKGIGKDIGDTVSVSLARDDEEREVEVPVELRLALDANPAASDAFDALSYSHRREHAMHVAEAKKPETRERRALKTVESLLG